MIPLFFFHSEETKVNKNAFQDIVNILISCFPILKKYLLLLSAHFGFVSFGLTLTLQFNH